MNTIGKEYIEPKEEYYAGKIADRFIQTLAKYYRSEKVKRMFHPKMHALLKAEFIVEASLPPHLKEGIFAEGKTYDAWVRFSNAKRKATKDKKKDLRGMALKLVGVEGKKLLEKEKDANTQDFLLVTSKTLQTASVKDFQRSIEALLGGFIKLFFYAITHPAVIVRSIKMISKCSNLLETSFYSMSPYKYGEGKAVKYAAFPQKKTTSSFPKDPSDDFLKERLISDLEEQEYSFDFMVQFQTDAQKMPIENPTVKWTSPFEKVATIKIKKQVFNSKAQESYGENLSFTPWHCIEAHRPLGGANRARKIVYEAIASFRRKQNHVEKLDEPNTIMSFDE